jgi:hypothetical protein
MKVMIIVLVELPALLIGRRLLREESIGRVRDRRGGVMRPERRLPSKTMTVRTVHK